jgi:hypothetical protein
VTGSSRPDGAKAAAGERLAAALRENLRRRKQQQALRRPVAPGGGPGPEGDPPVGATPDEDAAGAMDGARRP